MATEDVDADGDIDIIIVAMILSNVLRVQRKNANEKADINKTALIILKNST